jgi:YegS/Rv2252/BmrU family lipid kinase
MTTLSKSLRHRQRQHHELLAKVEKTVARLDRRRLKLTALESAIAELERRVAEPRKEPAANGTTLQGVRRAQLIFKPTTGQDEETNARRLSQIVSSLRTHGIEAIVGLKTSGKAARALARDAVRDGYPLVVVAAGDGTIDDVASQLIGTSTVLGLVPIGTMNNVARSLGVPLDIDDACALIGMGTTRHIDVGRVHTNQSQHAEYFLECAGVGLSAIGALGGQAFEKRRWRALPKVLQRFFEARLGRMQVELDDRVIEASTRIVTVCNAPLLGGNMLAAPGAKMDDGYLDVSVYDGMGDAALVGHFLAASSHTANELAIYRARRVRITTEQAVLANSDMSVSSERHVIEIDVLPAALAMIVGNGIALTIPVESAPAAPPYAVKPPGTNGSAPEKSSHLATAHA